MNFGIGYSTGIPVRVSCAYRPNNVQEHHQSPSNILHVLRNTNGLFSYVLLRSSSRSSSTATVGHTEDVGMHESKMDAPEKLPKAGLLVVHVLQGQEFGLYHFDWTWSLRSKWPVVVKIEQIRSDQGSTGCLINASELDPTFHFLLFQDWMSGSIVLETVEMNDQTAYLLDFYVSI